MINRCFTVWKWTKIFRWWWWLRWWKKNASSAYGFRLCYETLFFPSIVITFNWFFFICLSHFSFLEISSDAISFYYQANQKIFCSILLLLLRMIIVGAIELMIWYIFTLNEKNHSNRNDALTTINWKIICNTVAVDFMLLKILNFRE